MTSKQAAIKIIKRLHDKGFQALLAGGCVRDMLLGRSAKDFDVATDAKPQDVQKLFRRTLAVGAKFGVVIVMLDSCQVEVATFRTESGYADGRHPETVAFSNAREDAARRDFTINGMFYDPIDDEIFDYVGGGADLEAKTLRTIGEAGERFGEDYLRMLRAIRFSAQLDFAIDDGTWQGVCDNAGKITCISGERISMELEAVLVNVNRSKGVRLLCRSNLARAIFDGFTGEGVDFAIKVLGLLEGDVEYVLGLAGLFSGFQTTFAMKQTAILMLSNTQTRQLQFLMENRGRLLEVLTLADLKILLASGYFQTLYNLQTAIVKAEGRSQEPLKTIRQRADNLANTDIEPKPLLDGNELLDLAVPPGPAVGRAARQMYYLQLNDELTTKQQAVDWLKNYLKS
ncbi:MAG: CCA tRNA nucleotidyltransferase [Planctomycetes bacterium]|nr:CCA tRNA nucleotidyltransferase [Planctomycetota bacterium]